MAFRFYLDGQLTDQPMNDTDLSTSIKRDRQLNNLLVTQDVDLQYNGNNQPGTGSGEISGYEYLKNLFDINPCSEVELEIYDQIDSNTNYLFYKGTIKIPSIEIDLQKAILKTKIQDNSFYSYLNNNKNIEVDLSADQTKNQFPLIPLPKYTVDLFNQSNCLYGTSASPAVLYHMYLVTDVFAFIISAISDNKIGFQSDFLDNLSIKPLLCKGQDLINPYTIYPNAEETVIKLSFDTLFTEMKKMYNVFFWIDNTDINNPILRLENYNISFNQSTSFAFNDIKDIQTSIDVASLYSKVSVGSAKIESGLFPSGISYYGFKTEEFFPLGQCNIDNELNLVNEFIIDTNVIQDILVNSTVEYIDDIFIIECTNVDTINLLAEAYQYELSNDGNCWYNLGINNFNKVQRYENQFTTTFGNFTGVGGLGFQASLANFLSFTTNPTFGNYVTPVQFTLGGGFPPPIFTTIDPVVFGDETSGDNYDGGGNYDNTIGRYDISQDGQYNFLFNADSTISGVAAVTDGFWHVYYSITHYDSLGNVIDTFETTNFPNTRTNGNYIDTTTLAINGVIGDYVECKVKVNFYRVLLNGYTTMTFNQNTFFSCISTPDSNGGAGSSGNNNSNKYFYNFEYDINQTDFNTILSNVTNRVSFEKDGLVQYGWIEEIKRNDWTGIAQIKLITSNVPTSKQIPAILP